MIRPAPAACWHEAGHIVLFRQLLGARIKHVTFTPNGGAVTTVLTPVDRRPDHWGRALCLLAGPASESLYVGGRYGGQSDSDFDQAEDLLVGLGLALDQAWPEARRLVRQEQRAIAVIARYLAQHGGIDEARCAVVLGEARRAAPVGPAAC